eukprot:jgi/Ulvmu1/2650/UM014_0102.1
MTLSKHTCVLRIALYFAAGPLAQVLTVSADTAPSDAVLSTPQTAPEPTPQAACSCTSLCSDHRQAWARSRQGASQWQGREGRPGEESGSDSGGSRDSDTSLEDKHVSDNGSPMRMGKKHLHKTGLRCQLQARPDRNSCIKFVIACDQWCTL